MKHKKIDYSQNELNDAYQAWAMEPAFTDKKELNPKRIYLWNVYCDIRDGMPVGYSASPQGKKDRASRVITKSKDATPKNTLPI